MDMAVVLPYHDTPTPTPKPTPTPTNTNTYAPATTDCFNDKLPPNIQNLMNNNDRFFPSRQVMQTSIQSDVDDDDNDNDDIDDNNNDYNEGDSDGRNNTNNVYANNSKKCTQA